MRTQTNNIGTKKEKLSSRNITLLIIGIEFLLFGIAIALITTVFKPKKEADPVFSSNDPTEPETDKENGKKIILRNALDHNQCYVFNTSNYLFTLADCDRGDWYYYDKKNVLEFRENNKNILLGVSRNNEIISHGSSVSASEGIKIDFLNNHIYSGNDPKLYVGFVGGSYIWTTLEINSIPLFVSE